MLVHNRDPQPLAPIALDNGIPLPRVCVTPEALQKLRAYVALCPVEINGLGTVVRRGNDFLITDAFLIEQVASPAGVETNKEALGAFIYELVEAGGNPATLRLQWHSHVDFDVFCSPTDMETLNAYTADFMVNLVLNKRGEYHCRLDLYRPFRLGFLVRLYVAAPAIEEAVLAACRRDIEHRVTIRRRPTFWKRPPRLDAASPEGMPFSVPLETFLYEGEEE